MPFVLVLTIVGVGVAAVVWWRSGLTGGWLAVLVWVWTIGAAAISLVYRFYRDPERTPPDRGDVVLSPADGEVIYVYESDTESFRRQPSRVGSTRSESSSRRRSGRPTPP